MNKTTVFTLTIFIASLIVAGFAGYNWYQLSLTQVKSLDDFCISKGFIKASSSFPETDDEYNITTILCKKQIVQIDKDFSINKTTVEREFILDDSVKLFSLSIFHIIAFADVGGCFLLLIYVDDKNLDEMAASKL